MNRRFRKTCGCCRAVKIPINKLWKQTTGKQLFEEDSNHSSGAAHSHTWAPSPPWDAAFPLPPGAPKSLRKWPKLWLHSSLWRKGQTSAHGMGQQDEQRGISTRAPKLQGRQVKTTNKTRKMRDLWWILEKKQIGHSEVIKLHFVHPKIQREVIINLGM